MKVLGLFPFAFLLVLAACASTSPAPASAPTLRLRFVVDQQYDIDMTVGMFRSSDPAGLASRAQSMGVDAATAERIKHASTPAEARKLAAGLVGERFNGDGAAIRASVAEFEEDWRELLPLFSTVVIEKTEAAWVHPEYTCVVSAIHPGISDWFGNKVAVKFDKRASYKRRILAHEILLSNVFQLMRRRHSRSELSDWQVWAFSEITPVLILDDPRLNSFWPDFPSAGNWFRSSNYPQLAELEAQLRELFDGRTSYGDYEDRSALILRDFGALH